VAQFSSVTLLLRFRNGKNKEAESYYTGHDIININRDSFNYWSGIFTERSLLGLRARGHREEPVSPEGCGREAVENAVGREEPEVLSSALNAAEPRHHPLCDGLWQLCEDVDDADQAAVGRPLVLRDEQPSDNHARGDGVDRDPSALAFLGK